MERQVDLLRQGVAVFVWLLLACLGSAWAQQADSLECGSDVLDAAEHALHFEGREQFLRTCRLDPSANHRAIVAFTFPTIAKVTSGQATPDTDAYDLDIAIFDIATGSIVSNALEVASIPSDAIHFDDLRIDTGRYILAEGRRAFGIRTVHSPHCYGCFSRTEELALYLPNGQRISKVLATQVGEDRIEPSKRCPDGVNSNRTSLAVSSGKSHGMADVLLSTMTTFYCNDEQSKPAKSTKVLTLHFDGQVYPMPAP